MIAFFFRFLFILAIPNFSQDFYRFIWDGRMLFSGYNPYETTPLSWIEKSQFPVGQATQLFEGMGNLNAGHFTNYPPISQFVYWLAAVFGNASIRISVVVMRLVLIFSDVLIAYFGVDLLKRMELPKRNILWYILNPFVIIEIVGNLHFESLMVLMLLLSLWSLHRGSYYVSAFFLGCSVAVKLITLLLIPFFLTYFLRNFFWKTFSFKLWLRYLFFVIIVVGVFVVTFLPFLSSQVISNFTDSVGLWFGKFEFNASVYNLVKACVIYIVGWNLPAQISFVLTSFTLIVLGYLSFFRGNYEFSTLLGGMLLGFTVYLFFSSTIHPWYLTTPLLVSLFTPYRFLRLWTLTVFLSYAAYRNPDSFKEDVFLIAVEYSLDICFLICELFNWRILRFVSGAVGNSNPIVKFITRRFTKASNENWKC